ncbi:MAG: Ribosomal-protein-S5p-alanine acetyltransferase [uncultured Thermomicrobiales bacterium]|uniref:Ribosomal-protein-S5p-alanine acetyltransferase n=1 Tax=uncultured Thermomicrobiales bacterium TaxID=1645740 RepID=A0A6J4UIW9_9BACT|nr:MAG: Ribosomal-protein-S5p-alanine acetyltransferase [uncultured Thermomicrobiales bacterium]
MNGGDSRNLAPLTTEEVDWWYARLASQRFAWAIDLAGRGIGVARLTHVDEASRRMDYAIGILAPDLWNQGLGTEATRLVLRFAFDELRLHRVGLLVLDINERAQAMYEKCGFVREGVVREGVLVGDEWHSDVTMSILEAEYRQASVQWQ